MAPRDSDRPAHRTRESSGKRNHHKKRKSQPGQSSSRRRHHEAPSHEENSGEGGGGGGGSSSRRGGSSQGLSAGALARLNQENARSQKKRKSEGTPRRVSRREADEAERLVAERPRKHHRNNKRRVVSGAVLEEGRGTRGIRGGWGSWSDGNEKDEHYHRSGRRMNKKKRLWMIIGCVVVVLIIIIAVAVVVTKNNASQSSNPSTSGLSGQDRGSIPQKWQGTYLDPWTWADTKDFNATFTEQVVGNLPVMGLMTSWDDSKRANQYVPPLNQPWGSYGSRPARGVNLGGWLSLEPFITPSLFNYDPKLGIIDEWTLCKYLGPEKAAATLEKHYATFVTEATFAAIADAGLDHVRIPFSYWAVQTYDDDPYVFRTSWRYLLRGIEWARKYGLRINLDLHGIPGSQNGWNHSGRQGEIGWLSGPNGQVNAQRSLDMHDRLSKFFAQDRYKHIVAFYGLANEPKMTYLSVSDVISWTTSAYKLIRANGVGAVVVFGDGFMGLGNWRGLMPGYDDMALDVHQYVIFNTNQIVFTHQKKVQYACAGWTQQARDSMSTATGYGPTLFAEWSQADTDCARHLTNVGWGNRWTGTYDSGNGSTSALTPRCPTTDAQCSCAQANVADARQFSTPYKTFLKMFAEAQMESFEHGWGWWYWTWDTESAPLWSYRAGLAAGILPAKAYDRDFDCSQPVPSFSDLPEYY